MFFDSKSVLSCIADIEKSKIVILDIRMSDINGIQLYQILKILNPSIKAIFMSALDAVNELASLYSDIKPSDIIRKPVNKDKFIQTVNDKVKTLVVGV
jgi:two-component system response regulator ChvI